VRSPHAPGALPAHAPPQGVRRAGPVAPFSGAERVCRGRREGALAGEAGQPGPV